MAHDRMGIVVIRIRICIITSVIAEKTLTWRLNVNINLFASEESEANALPI